MAPKLDQASQRSCFFLFFKSTSRPLGLFMLLFRDASVLSPKVRGRSSTGAIPLLLPSALSRWFTTHTGPCHSAPTQPSLTPTCVWICRATLAGKHARLSLAEPLRPLGYLEIPTLEDDAQKTPTVSEEVQWPGIYWRRDLIWPCM